MPTPFHNTVSLRGFHFEDFILTVKLAAGITQADEGKAVTVGAAANTFKLAADGEDIVGRLLVVEDRTVEGQLVGSVEFRFANHLPIKSGETVVAGDTVVGAGNGEVKALKVSGASAPDHSKNFVAEVVGSNAVVVKV